nr:dentin sialoprotein [Tanacetum cinerariifolium]
MSLLCLQGPVVTKSAGSWVITPVVEYYYLLPYADIISKFFSRGSNGLPHQVIGKCSAHNSSKEEPRDNKVAKKTHESIRQDATSITTTTVDRVSKVAYDVNTSGARGAGSCGREWGEVVGSSWSGGGVVRMGEKGAVSLAGMVECTVVV